MMPTHSRKQDEEGPPPAKRQKTGGGGQLGHGKGEEFGRSGTCGPDTCTCSACKLYRANGKKEKCPKCAPFTNLMGKGPCPHHICAHHLKNTSFRHISRKRSRCAICSPRCPVTGGVILGRKPKGGKEGPPPCNTQFCRKVLHGLRCPEMDLLFDAALQHLEECHRPEDKPKLVSTDKCWVLTRRTNQICLIPLLQDNIRNRREMENSQRNGLLSTLGSSEEEILHIMDTKGLQVCMRN